MARMIYPTGEPAASGRSSWSALQEGLGQHQAKAPVLINPQALKNFHIPPSQGG